MNDFLRDLARIIQTLWDDGLFRAGVTTLVIGALVISFVPGTFVNLLGTGLYMVGLGMVYVGSISSLMPGIADGLRRA